MKVDNDGEISEWNEAVFMMKRLHELQTEINRVKMDPLSKHDLKPHLYNYQVWINSVSALYSECQSKYSADEVKEVNKLKKLIEQFLEKQPIHNIVLSEGYSCKRERRAVVSQENWKTLRAVIEIFESRVKSNNDKHGLSTKNQENMDGRSILR